ncbi:hypothetical protein [Tenacibaculum agarivorans]|uniref:hypothetical protein n=1 Tax=Tenacibaculum agarivorans TaxID=1908389 RepID=UPI00094B8852|nr:hypothetical protein [Tenacibaculum agarivorans]
MTPLYKRTILNLNDSGNSNTTIDGSVVPFTPIMYANNPAINENFNYQFIVQESYYLVQGGLTFLNIRLTNIDQAPATEGILYIEVPEAAIPNQTFMTTNVLFTGLDQNYRIINATRIFHNGKLKLQFHTLNPDGSSNRNSLANANFSNGHLHIQALSLTQIPTT